MASKGGVYLGYLHPHTLSGSFHRSLLDLLMFDAKNSGFITQHGSTKAAGYGLPEARNSMAEHVLSTDCEWWLSVDADMGFAPYVLDQLMLVAAENELRIVGGLCFAQREIGFDGINGIQYYPLPTIYDYGLDPATGVEDFRGKAHYPVNTLVRSSATGMAMVLIHRTVLEEVHAKYGPEWFTRLPGPTGMRGEDISFFMRTAAVGIPCYVHTGVRTNHHKSTWVQEADFWESFNAPPATEEVDVIVPTVRARSGNIPELAASLKASTGLARLVLVLDDEEHRQEIAEMGVGFAHVIQPGSFARKINAAYRELEDLNPRPWFQVVGDDCRFHPAWLDHKQLVSKFYNAKVIGSDDMANPRVVRGEHATHWMIARDYIDEQGASWDGPGVVAHEGYRHWFVDDEIVTVARQRGVFQMALGAKIEHLHPIVGKAAVDEVYEKNDKYATQDRQLFEKRLKANV